VYSTWEIEIIILSFPVMLRKLTWRRKILGTVGGNKTTPFVRKFKRAVLGRKEDCATNYVTTRFNMKPV
jgi:hypothetical protein